MSALPIVNMDHRMTECSTSGSLGDVSLIQNAVLQLYRRNVPLLHTSRYITVQLSFTRPSPALELQATNTGVRRPGYEAGFTGELLLQKI